MSEAKEQLRRKMLEKRGTEACEKYKEMFNKEVMILVPNGYPTNDEKYLKKVEECIKRGSPLTDDDIEEIRPTGDGTVY